MSACMNVRMYVALCMCISMKGGGGLGKFIGAVGPFLEGREVGGRGLVSSVKLFIGKRRRKKVN